MAAARAERVRRPKKRPASASGASVRRSGRSAVQIPPNTRPSSTPQAQKTAREGASAIETSPITQPQSTRRRVRRGPIRSLTKPVANEPAAAGTVRTAKRVVSPPTGRPRTETAKMAMKAIVVPRASW